MRARVPYAFSPERHRSGKLRNVAHSALLLAAMLGVLGLCAFAAWGWTGALTALLGGALGLALAPSVSPEWLLRLYKAREIHPRELPDLVRLLDAPARRAGLPRPRLFYVPSRALNAFAVGRPEASCVAVTHGLLEALTRRELAGVLAHELSHIRNRDLWLMMLADAIGRLTSLVSNAGLVLLVLNLPLVLTGQALAPWALVALLVLAPTATSLLQLALSRAREFDADLDAARLTGDPAGLASALAKLERRQGRFWEEVILPGRRMPDPSLLRTHPPSRERVRRLLELYAPAGPLPEIEDGPVDLPAYAAARLAPPRLRWHGVWY
jgi:heat shock protein HtpX